MHRIVRSTVRDIEEERPIAAALDKVDGLLGHQLGEVAAVVPDLPVVVPQVVNRVRAAPLPVVVDVGVVINAAGKKPEELIESVGVGTTLVRYAQVPLSELRRPVSVRLEQRGDGLLV